MSTERLGDGEDRSSAASRGAVQVLDLDGRAPPASPPHADRRPSLHSVGAALALLGIALAGGPEPRRLPDPADLQVRISAGVQWWDGAAEPLGATKVVVHVRNTSADPVEISRVQVLGVGSRPTAQLRGVVTLGPGDAARVPVTVLPDCRAVGSGADDDLSVLLTARGPSGGGAVHAVAGTDGQPLAAVCPERIPGVHVVLTGHRVTQDGSAVELRLVNAGTETVLVGEPGAPRPSARLTARPRLPLQLAAGDAKVVRVRWNAACPPSRAVAVPRLEARGEHGWQPVRDSRGAVPGVSSAVDGRC